MTSPGESTVGVRALDDLEARARPAKTRCCLLGYTTRPVGEVDVGSSGLVAGSGCHAARSTRSAVAHYLHLTSFGII
jgi:hypothetical protein